MRIASYELGRNTYEIYGVAPFMVISIDIPESSKTSEVPNVYFVEPVSDLFVDFTYTSCPLVFWNAICRIPSVPIHAFM